MVSSVINDSHLTPTNLADATSTIHVQRPLDYGDINVFIAFKIKNQFTLIIYS